MTTSNHEGYEGEGLGPSDHAEGDRTKDEADTPAPVIGDSEPDSDERRDRTKEDDDAG